MDQQEQGFLSAALGVGDERLEQRLLVGYHLVRDCCRIADDPDWVPRTHAAREAMNAAIMEGAFVPGDMELVALDTLLQAFETAPSDRARLFAALQAYAVALMRESQYGPARSILELLYRFWQPSVAATDRMEAIFFHCQMLVRDAHHVREAAEMPLLLARHARAAREREYIGLARTLKVDWNTYAGNQPRAFAQTERLFNWLRRHPSRRIEGQLLVRRATLQGRAAQFEQVLQTAKRVLDGDYERLHRLGALYLSGMALMDLGEYQAAEAAFELLLLAPTALNRSMGWLGLMDVFARRGDKSRFERIYERLESQPLMANLRIYFYQIAGRAWVKLGGVSRARAELDKARALAERLGRAYDLFETEDDIARLPDEARRTQASELLSGVTASVIALHDSHADEIAACMA